MSGQQTVLEALIERLRKAAEHNSEDQVAPAVILWTDKEEQWAPLLPRLRDALPELLTLGPYDPAAKAGPAIWLRCMIARELPEADWPENAAPIVYLPGVSRQELRAVEECPRPLQPLAELQYRGVLFTQLNARDWTIMAFLVSEDGGLGLDVARDAKTEEAMRRALLVLADTPVAELRGRRLHAADFDALVNPDEIRSLLMWLNDPDAIRARWDANEWGAFRARCVERFGFDPETDGPLVGAQQLGLRQHDWDTVWRRIDEAPARYPGLPELLRQACPTATDDLFFKRSSWPQINEEAEDEVRERLSQFANSPPAEARAALAALEGKHAERRQWVWARLGMAPLACALEPLAALAAVTATPLGGSTPEEVAEVYIGGMWQADAAVLGALAAVEQPADVAAVHQAIRAVYAPWLEASARHLQEVVRQHPLPVSALPPTQPTPGTCMVFADGLRFDVAEKLRMALASAEAEVTVGWTFAAVPSVTPTAKPAASPVAALVTGGDVGAGFVPCVLADGKELTADRFQKLLAEQGHAVLAEQDTGSPTDAGWTEAGSLDKRGHDEGWKLARRIDEEVRSLTMRVQQLLDAGWREVGIITDHGWLLLPGGLPKTTLPEYLAETRWGRCAVLKASSKADLMTVPWRWNQDVRIAPAPGISCFIAGREYAHGGLSVQECVLPVLTVRPTAAQVSVSIAEVKWVGLRCRVRVSGGAGCEVDLRTKAADASTTIADERKPVDGDGLASLAVRNPDNEGTAVNVVVLDAKGKVVARASTTVGG